MAATTARPASPPAVPGGTMTAVAQQTYGGPEVLRLGERPVPELAADQVLVQVRAAGLDRGTWHLMEGLPHVVRLGFGLRRPKQPVPGLDLAGTVVAVGDDVTRFSPGDEVLGIGQASFAAYAAAPESKLVHKPASLTWEQAAVLPVSGLTALQAVRDQADVEAGQHVLVLGASGGVGSYAVQIAKAMGAEVTGVASAAKLDFVRDLGADHTIDHATGDFAEPGGRFDVIIDVGGNNSLRRLRRALTPTGTLVIVGGEQGGRLIGGIDRQGRAMLLSPFVRQRLTTFISTETAEDLEPLAAMAADGRLTPAVDRTYPLAEAADAMARLAAGEVRGKVAVLP